MSECIGAMLGSHKGVYGTVRVPSGRKAAYQTEAVSDLKPVECLKPKGMCFVPLL